jgi:hypothetical protein
MTLIDFLNKSSLIHSRFAERCGIKKSAFCRYVNKSRKPDPITAMKIKKESKNKVTEFDTIIDNHLEEIRNSSSI